MIIIIYFSSLKLLKMLLIYILDVQNIMRTVQSRIITQAVLQWVDWRQWNLKERRYVRKLCRKKKKLKWRQWELKEEDIFKSFLKKI